MYSREYIMITYFREENAYYVTPKEYLMRRYPYKSLAEDIYQLLCQSGPYQCNAGLPHGLLSAKFPSIFYGIDYLPDAYPQYFYRARLVVIMTEELFPADQTSRKYVLRISDILQGRESFDATGKLTEERYNQMIDYLASQFDSASIVQVPTTDMSTATNSQNGTVRSLKEGMARIKKKRG